MTNQEKKISNYIDRLNKEKKPNEHIKGMDEQEELKGAVRLIKSLKEVDYPDEEFPKRLADSLINQSERKGESYNPKKVWLPLTAAFAAVMAIVLIINVILPRSNTNIVYAMERAYQEVKAYHGILEITQSNALGEVTTQAVREVWADKKGNYYVKEVEGSEKGMITINNGEKKWQIQPEQKQVNTFPAFPDPYQFTFEIGNEVQDIKNALEVKTVGEEEIAGRKTKVLSVTPEGGDAYRLWVDQETDMPLQKESAMQNAIQYKVTYSEFDFTDAIPEDFLTFQIPKEYKATDTDGEQFVNNLDEAVKIAGFTPKIIDNLEDSFMYSAISVEPDRNKINVYYKNNENQNTAVIAQQKAVSDLNPDSSAILGTVNHHTAEVLINADQAAGNMGGGAYAGITGISSIRWQEEGMEYTVYGELSTDELINFAKNISSGDVNIPVSESELQEKPQIEVPIDIEAETNEQKSVDAGHSPWKLDPAFVAQVYASLLISPEGIVGDYPIAYEDISIVQNNGKTAIAEIKGDATTVSRVYLKRLVRQDSTGIWTVVGYDPVNK